LTKEINRNIADYYNQTLNHYQTWWKLDRVLAVHYGIWDSTTKNFRESLINTNRILVGASELKPHSRVLDAGCGVGGSAFYLAKEKEARVTGVTLSEKQLAFANRKRGELGMANLVDFKLEDYTRTSLEGNSFDLVWAIESVTSAPDKRKFAHEAFLLLKPGGRLVIADYFLPKDTKVDKYNWLKKWQHSWSLSGFLTVDDYAAEFRDEGLQLTRKGNVTANIYPTAWIMYRSYLLGAIPSRIYNLFHNTSRYAKTHYKSGKYQYKALKEGLWEYWILVFEKKKTGREFNPEFLQLERPYRGQKDGLFSIRPWRVFTKTPNLS
jgi:cyclopropane fatty-acyl-phospholipid synthase-like methyltransferase